MIIIKGNIIKEEILNTLKSEVSRLEEKPKFAVLQIGEDEGSNIYIGQKEKMAIYVGYEFIWIKLSSDSSLDEILFEIDKLNNDDSINGIMVELPVPKNIDLNIVRNSIVPIKDIDCLNDSNLGKIFGGEEIFLPSTVGAIWKVIKQYNIEIIGKRIVIIGRSILIGKPLSILLMNAGATVTVCNSKTKNLHSYIKEADVIISATGVPKLITDDMIHDGQVVIDAGIVRVNGKISGDVFLTEEKNIMITPVPNGIGPITTAILAKNILNAYNLQKGDNNE